MLGAGRLVPHQGTNLRQSPSEDMVGIQNMECGESFVEARGECSNLGSGFDGPLTLDSHVPSVGLSFFICQGLSALGRCREVVAMRRLLPGSSPGGSREFEAGTASARIRKQLLN